jgi:RNA recognition motif-containing protein
MSFVLIGVALCVGLVCGFILGRSKRTKEETPLKARAVSSSPVGEGPKSTISNIYVGNLSPDVSDADLRETFEVFGKVQEATIIKDRSKGGHKRFAFVEMMKADEAQAAIKALDGRDLKGRTLKVKEAHNRGSVNRPSRPRGGARRTNKRRPERRPESVAEMQ